MKRCFIWNMPCIEAGRKRNTGIVKLFLNPYKKMKKLLSGACY